MPPKISVIIPIYNMASCLEQSLNSVCQNTFRDIEVICINDGSKDDSLSILKNFAEKESRVRIIDQPNGGVSAARNAGLEIVSGEYVSFVDPDDLLHPQFFEVMLSMTEHTHADCTICFFERVNEDDIPISMSAKESAHFQYRIIGMETFFQNHQCRTYCCGRLIKAELATAIRFDTQIRIGEDGAYISELWSVFPAMQVCLLYESLYYYIQRDGSAMGHASEEDLFALAKIYETKMTNETVTDRIYLLQTIRRGLTVRYLCTHIHPNPKLTRECKALLRRCGKRLSHTKDIKTKQKLLHLVLIFCPGLYWLYRARQPGMLRWELVERKKRMEKILHRRDQVKDETNGV